MSRAVDEAARHLAGEVDGLKAKVEELRGELVASVAEVGRLQVERDAWKDAHERQGGVVQVATAERGRVRAQNERLVKANDRLTRQLQDARSRVIVLERWREQAEVAREEFVRAMVEANLDMRTTVFEAAEVNHGRGDRQGVAQPPGAAAAPTGQAGGAQSGSAGPPAGPIEILCVCGHPPDEHFEGGDIGWGSCKHRDGCTGSGTF